MEQNNLPAQRRKRSLRSSFTATCGKYFFLKIGLALLSIIPFCLPVAVCIHERYKCSHTEIVGMPLEFTGKAGELLGKMIVWGLLSIVTIGIYALVVLPVRYEQWKTAHTVFGPVVM